MNEDELDLINQRLDRLEDSLDNIASAFGLKTHKQQETHPITAILAIIIVFVVIGFIWSMGN